MKNREINAKSGNPGHLRLLKPNERVNLGDFVANGHQSFELWEGPSGFRADSFIKPIYRKNESYPSATK
jgi:hypothetical protein